MTPLLDIVILGPALRSSCGNDHATTYRGLVKALQRRGHRVVFLERDVPWYAGQQDLPEELTGALDLYSGLDELGDRHGLAIANADLVIVGSCVPDGIQVGARVQALAHGIVAFYDLDTPVTLAKLARGECDYLDPRQVPDYDLYLSFTGGPVLRTLERRFGSPLALPLYCSFDPERCAPEPVPLRYDLGYMGAYSGRRQPILDRMLLAPARAWPDGSFIVAGPQYPDHLQWPANVHRVDHLGPALHPRFYNVQRFTLNLTNAGLVTGGWSPSVSLFEAAACATPVVSDAWEGLDTMFEPGREMLIAWSAADVLQWIRAMPEEQRRRIGEAGRQRVLAEHTAEHRAQTLEQHFERAVRRKAARSAVGPCSRTGQSGRSASQPSIADVRQERV